MSDLYVYTLFEKDGGKPRCTGIKAGNRIQTYEFFRPGAKKTIASIRQHKELIRDLILKANNLNHRIITSDFKGHLIAFGLPLDVRPYNVYDLHLPDIGPQESSAKDIEFIRCVLEKMATTKVKDYHKVYANAAVVYQDLQNRGLENNYQAVFPVWSQKTFSGRSKTTVFSIQGFTDEHLVFPPGVGDKNVLIHFDWICADIRAASLLSGDQRLQEAFEKSDPYVYMMERINAESSTPIDRDECKIFLLKSINSMDFGSVALTKIYPELGEWIVRCKHEMDRKGGYLETLLGRRFRVARAKNQLAVLNGAMQGSVAHAMQNVLRKTWERIGNRVVADVHDSMVVCAPNESNEIMATVGAIAPLMLYPFEGLLPDNPSFPVKVSIGRRWRKWKLFATYRASGVEYAKRETKITDQKEGDGAGTETETQSGTPP